MSSRKVIFVLLLIFMLGLAVRVASVYPANTTVGFDQARDFFDSRKIVLEHDLRIVGPTAGNNANLHHGVAFLYFILPAIFVGGGNPFWIALENSFVNAASSLVLFFFAASLFKSKKAALITAFVSAVSFYFVEFSGWVSNPGITLFTVPLFFFGIWQYRQGKKFGLPLATFFLGITIEFELFFIYLIPVFLIIFPLLRLKLPDIKTGVLSVLAFCLATSTMILTEFKFGFSGVKSLLAGGAAKQPMSYLLTNFFQRFSDTFSQTLWPQSLPYAAVLAGLIVGYILFSYFRTKNKEEKTALLFLIIYLFSPMIMLLLGTHAAPWFLIGVPPAIALATGYVFMKKQPVILIIAVLTFIGIVNIQTVKNSYGAGQPLLEPDRAAILSSQLAAIDYTYQSSNSQPFAINTVTNPLYINAVWAWNYDWYGKKYGYFPAWLGGDQLSPYNTLGKPTGREKYFYLIVDETPRIPEVHRILAKEWAGKEGKFIEEHDFGGILVQKYSF